MSSTATVRLVGNLGKVVSSDGKATRINAVEIDVPLELDSVISQIENRFGLVARRDSILVLVNGVEANALNGLSTIIKSGDEVVLVPMYHGGLSIH